MNDRLIHLRIKIKSLAAEAAIIRKEANRTKGPTKWGLNAHRTGTVRSEARLSLLAYGLLRRVPYNVMEKTCDEAPNFSKVADFARRFGETDEKYLATWVADAKKHIDGQVKTK